MPTEKKEKLIYLFIFDLIDQKFHSIPTRLTLSRLNLSFKCHPGVLEDWIVPDMLGEDALNLINVF